MIRIIVGTAQHALELEQCIKKLRDYYGDREFEIKGIDNIVDYMNRLGYVNRKGKPITKHVLYEWKRSKKFPMHALCKKDGLLTSNVLIQAWLWSLVNAAWREYKRPHPHAGICLKTIAGRGIKRIRCPRLRPCPIHPS